MKASIVTFGCKVNQFESTAMAEMLNSIGYELTGSEEADLVVVNTCTVTQRADGEAISLFKSLKRLNPKATVVATGCLAQLAPDKLTGLVDLVLGQREKASLIEYLNLPKGSVLVSENLSAISDFGAPQPKRTRAFHKIQDGCQAYCSYCAVPFARGPSRSEPLEKILNSLTSYLNMGIYELVLTGIHLGHWGRDLLPPQSLAALLEAIDGGIRNKYSNFRIRLSSLEPLEIPLVTKALAEFPWLAPHIHAPLQSGSDRILALMGRPYRREEVFSIFSKLKEKFKDLNLGTDIICGFPSESEEDFEESIKLIEELPFGYLHVFPYSPRSGTKAAELPQKVPEAVKSRRVKKLREVGQVKRNTFLKTQYGKTRLALVENTLHRASGRAKVLTDNYLQALLPLGFKFTAGVIKVTLAPSDNPWGLAQALPESAK
jgi:threonylcarbamoyladenosine tRNA methylthiotransferase MtaB